MRNHNTVFCRGCSILYSNQLCTRARTCSHSLVYLLFWGIFFFFFLIKQPSYLMGVRWDLTVVLTFISLMINNTEDLSIWFVGYFYEIISFNLVIKNFELVLEYVWGFKRIYICKVRPLKSRTVSLASKSLF